MREIVMVAMVALAGCDALPLPAGDMATPQSIDLGSVDLSRDMSARSDLSTCGVSGTPCCEDVRGFLFCLSTAVMCIDGLCQVPPPDLALTPIPDMATIPDLAQPPDLACSMICGDVPNGVSRCRGGACIIDCANGFGDCDGDYATGCEANLDDDKKNCGKCGRACQFNCVGASCFPF